MSLEIMLPSRSCSSVTVLYGLVVNLLNANLSM